MKKTRVGLVGFGKTGKLVVNEFLKENNFIVSWVIRKGEAERLKYASRLLGHEFDAGKIYSFADIDAAFFKLNPVDVIVDFSDAQGLYIYQAAIESGTPLVSAISQYELPEMELLQKYAKLAPVLHSPNITLGINVLMVAAQILQKILPHADIEIVEEHFKDKPEVSGTAKKIAKALELDAKEHINSIRVGGIIGRHEIIFGMPNQIIRLSHESINRAAFGQGAIFAVNYLLQQSPGAYTMETIVAEMFRKNIPIY